MPRTLTILIRSQLVFLDQKQKFFFGTELVENERRFFDRDSTLIWKKIFFQFQKLKFSCNFKIKFVKFSCNLLNFCKLN